MMSQGKIRLLFATWALLAAPVATAAVSIVCEPTYDGLWCEARTFDEACPSDCYYTWHVTSPPAIVTPNGFTNTVEGSGKFMINIDCFSYAGKTDVSVEVDFPDGSSSSHTKQAQCPN